MAVRGSRGTSSLFTPLNILDVLIPDEVVQYNERNHWASLIQPFIETVAILIFITMFAGGLPSGAVGGFLFLFALVVVLVMWRTRRLRRLRAVVDNVPPALFRPSLFVVAVGLIIGLLVFGLESMAIALILAAASRFIYRSAMWAFYERLIITNRRVISSSGFLGAHIDAMPLTRITDIAFKRTVPGEVLDYGTLRIESAGQDQALSVLNFLNQPDVFYNILIGLSTTAIGSVKDPLTSEKMAESRAVTIKPRSDRPVRLPSILRRLTGSGGSRARSAGSVRSSDLADLADIDDASTTAPVPPVTETDFEDGT